MRPLQKPFSVQLGKNTDFHNYSNINKVEHERRERGFQVFISGANKERLKLRDLQQEAFQAKKAQIHTNISSARKIKPPNNTSARRKFWQKSTEIKIKGSDGSNFALQNQKSPKPDTGPYGSVLHDITAKTVEFHPSARNNSQLNLIRNRYKAYFHIDRYGFCCSKQTSKPSTPAKYQIDGASPIFNRSGSRHLKQIQNKPVYSSCSPQPYDNEEQKSQYFSVLNWNHERVGKLREILTPDYEYFRSAKEGTDPDSYKGVANEAIHAESCDGIIYDVFYHKEQNISRSYRALLPVDSQDENGAVSDDGNEKDAGNVFSQDEPYLRASLSVGNLEKNKDENEGENVHYPDERALVLLDNQGSLDGIGDNGNEETEYLPPLGKALSPISKLVENSNHEHEKESFLAQEYQSFLNHDDKSSSNSIKDCDLGSEIVDNGKRNPLKLNLRYLCQGLNFKVPNAPTLDPVQSYGGDETSTSSNDNGSSQTPERSTTDSSTPGSYNISPAWMSGHEKLNPRLLMEEMSNPVVDFGIAAKIDKKNRFPICKETGRVERTTKRGKLLSARVKKLDFKKQIYLSHILDKLEIAQVTGSIDLNFCQLGYHDPGTEERLPTQSLA